jgi:hypothetical protein
MSENAFLAAFFFPAAAFVLTFFMKYVSAVLQARVRLGQDEACREIASKAAAAQVETAALLSQILARVTVVEKILKEVE